MSSRKARLARPQAPSTGKAIPLTHRARKRVAPRQAIPSALAVVVLLLAIIGVTAITVTLRTSSSAAQSAGSAAAPPQPIAKSAQVLVYVPDAQPAWQTKTLATVANDSEFQYEGRLYHIDAAGVMRRREYVDVNVLADTGRVYDPANWRFPESGDVVRFVDSAGQHRFHQIMDRFAAGDRFWFQGVLYAVFADLQSPSGLAYQPAGRVLDIDGQVVSTAEYVARHDSGAAIAQAQDPTKPGYNPTVAAAVASSTPEQLGLMPRLETSQAVAAPPVAPASAAAPAAGSGLPTDYLFTGQKWDSATGLYKMGDRYYDPTLGRFISPDSFIPDLTNPQDLNRYAYARNNPLRYVDPSGHTVISALDLIIQNQDAIKSLAAKYNIDPLLLAGVVFAENRNDHNLVRDADWSSLLAPFGVGGPELKNFLAPMIKANPSLGITEVSVVVAAMMDDPSLIPTNYADMNWEERATAHAQIAKQLTDAKRQAILGSLADSKVSLEYSAKYLKFLSGNRDYQGNVALQLADYNRGLSSYDTLTPYANRYVQYQKNIEHALNVNIGELPAYSGANWGSYIQAAYGDLP